MGAAGSFRALATFLFSWDGLDMPEQGETGGCGDLAVEVAGTLAEVATRQGHGLDRGDATAAESKLQVRVMGYEVPVLAIGSSVKEAD